MTGPRIQSVDDPAFSYGEYDYEYDYTFEDMWTDTPDNGQGSAGLMLAKNNDFDVADDDIHNEQCSIDGPLLPRKQKDSRPLEPNGRKAIANSKSKLDPPTLEELVPCTPCYSDAAGCHLSSALPTRRRPKDKPKRQQPKGPFDSTSKTSSGDDSYEDDDCCAILGLNEVFVSDAFEPNTQHKPALRVGSRSKAKVSGSPQEGAIAVGRQLLCIHVCPHVDCNAAKCQPPDLRQASQNQEKILKKPSFFYVPSELVLQRDQEMRQAAADANIPKSRWNGSLLYHKWQEYQQNPHSREYSDDPVVITIHPVQTLAQGHVISPKFPWWQSWLTRFIRAYYNTGSLRIPAECQGLEVLLALEFFGILYKSPDQLSFDAPHVYHRVKQWSRYFTHRAILAQWIVDRLQDRVQQVQSTTSSGEDLLIQKPFVFCSHPDEVKSGYSFSLGGEQDLSIEVLEGGLDTSDPEHPTSSYTSLRGKAKAKSSAQLVHAFFVPSLELHLTQSDTNTSAPQSTPPEVIPAMMRQDFACFLEHVLPDWDISFSLQAVQLVSTNRDYLKKRETLLPSAVLVLTWSPLTAVEVEKKVDPPVNISAPLKAVEKEKKVDPPVNISAPKGEDNDDDGVSCFSNFSSSSCDSSAASVGATSISAAPTDEMAFGRLLSKTHKAVSRLLQHSTQEKAGGIRIGEENGFYFHREATKKSESLNKTLDTTSSSSSTAISSTSRPQNSSRSTSSSSKNANTEKRSYKDPRTGAIKSIPPEKLQRADQATKQSQLNALPPSTPSLVPFPTVSPEQRNNDDYDDEKSRGEIGRTPASRHGYTPAPSQWASIPSDHIYADLYNDCMFPSSALEDDKIPSTMTQMSPLWTPSLVNQAPNRQQQTPKQDAPIFSTTSKDHVSVTSSVTRSLLSAGTWQQAVQKATNRELQQGSRIVAAQEESDNRTFMMTSQDGGARPFHSGQSRNFDDKVSRKNETSKKKSYQKKTNKARTKRRGKKSLLDEMDMGLGFDVSGLDLNIDDIRQAYDIEKPTEESCQLLNDLYDFFVAEEKPTVVVVPPPTKLSGQGYQRGSSLSSESIGMESLSNQPELQKKLRKRATVSGGKKLEAEEKEPGKASIYQWMTGSNATSSVVVKEGKDSLPFVQKNASKVKIPLVTSRTVNECNRVNALNKLSEPEEPDEADKHGIEVYHVMMSSKEEGDDPIRSPSKSEDHRPPQPRMRSFEKDAGMRGTKKAGPKRQASSSKKEVGGRKKGLLRLLRRK